MSIYIYIYSCHKCVLGEGGWIWFFCFFEASVGCISLLEFEFADWPRAWSKICMVHNLYILVYYTCGHYFCRSHTQYPWPLRQPHCAFPGTPSQLSSVQFKMVSMCSEKPISAPPHLSEVSPASPFKWFQCLSDWWWPAQLSELRQRRPEWERIVSKISHVAFFAASQVSTD